MPKKTKWLDRDLFVSPVYYCLCTSKKQFKKALKEIGQDFDSNRFLNCGSNATTHFFTKENESCAIVCLGITDGYSNPQVYALLVHEAVHIWQEVRLITGEMTPSTEFEAYAIQSISQRLMESYDK